MFMEFNNNTTGAIVKTKSVKHMTSRGGSVAWNPTYGLVSKMSLRTCFRTYKISSMGGPPDKGNNKITELRTILQRDIAILYLMFSFLSY